MSLMSPGGQSEGTDGGNLAEPAFLPRLLTGAARPEMIQISMFVLMMLSSAHSQPLVGAVGVLPWGWDKHGKAMLPWLLAQPQQSCSWPGCGIPQHHRMAGAPRSFAFAGPGTQQLPAQVVAVRLPPGTTSSNSSFSPSFVH